VKNVTIKLSDEAADWIRIHAAERKTSVSQLLGEMVAERMRASRGYEAARRHFLTRPLRPLSNPGERYPTREELYDRYDRSRIR
jgi:hypothetical protein